MKHVTIADKSLLAGNEVVDLLIEYATLLGQERSADSVDITAIEADGDTVVVTFLLNAGVSIVAETTRSQMAEPVNIETEQYLRTRISALRGGDAPSPEEVSGATVWNATAPD